VPLGRTQTIFWPFVDCGIDRSYSGEFPFTPSAWKTPQRARTGETPLKDLASSTPSHFLGTPGPAYRAEFGTPSPSLKHRGVPEAHQTPMANVGVTPTRIMGPPPRHDLLL
jgi:hypothetical protein